MFFQLRGKLWAGEKKRILNSEKPPHYQYHHHLSIQHDRAIFLQKLLATPILYFKVEISSEGITSDDISTL